MYLSGYGVETQWNYCTVPQNHKLATPLKNRPRHKRPPPPRTPHRNPPAATPDHPPTHTHTHTEPPEALRTTPPAAAPNDMLKTMIPWHARCNKVHISPQQTSILPKALWKCPSPLSSRDVFKKSLRRLG